MNDCFNVMAAEYVINNRNITYILLDENGIWMNRITVPLCQVIQSNNLVSLFYKLLGKDTSYIAGDLCY